MTSLPKLSGSDFSVTTQINDNDDVVGNGNVPFLYHDGVMSDLNSLVNLPSGTKLTKAWGINNKGHQDWRLLCETTPMTWNHITYNTPTHCDDRVSLKIVR